MREIAGMGLKILVTELDVYDEGLPAEIERRDQRTAQVYREFLEIVLEEPATIGVLTWGLSDRYTWLSSFRPRRDGVPVRPLPLDAALGRKPIWSALAAAFDHRRG